ncbi:MAG: 2-C-methyl-D-erythritol 4-phosphate cytidylyltransferase [Parahaliea sp.]
MSVAALYAVVPAAGIGRRMGSDCPKQYLPLAGATVLEHSLRALLRLDRLVRVAVALHPDDTRASALGLLQDPRVLCLAGGAERADSVLAGLKGLQEFAYEDDWVLVHDAARPCLRLADLEALVERVLDTQEGGILAQPVVDTLKFAGASGRVECTVDRQHCWRAQTPQMFRFGQLREALAGALAAGVAVTDEASAMEWAGHPVHLVPGGGDNLKVTVADDLALAAFYLQAQTGGEQP